MPSQPRKNKGTYVELPEDVVEGLRALARANGRAMRDELEHAARRHLAAPPVVEVKVTTPPLPPAALPATAPTGDASPPAGRPRLRGRPAGDRSRNISEVELNFLK